MIVYLAGKIKGDPAYKQKFNSYKEVIESRGHVVLNPAVLPFGMPDEKYMPICIAMLEAADAICLIPDYTESDGAALELAFALYQNKEIITI